MRRERTEREQNGAGSHKKGNRYHRKWNIMFRVGSHAQMISRPHTRRELALGNERASGPLPIERDKAPITLPDLRHELAQLHSRRVACALLQCGAMLSRPRQIAHIPKTAIGASKPPQSRSTENQHRARLRALHGDLSTSTSHFRFNYLGVPRLRGPLASGSQRSRSLGRPRGSAALVTWSGG